MKKIKLFLTKFSTWKPNRVSMATLLLLPIFFFFLLEFKLDNDLWFLVKTGETLLKKGFITEELFTIHENLFFLPQQWLSSIIFYFIFDHFKEIGLFFLCFICLLIINFLIYKISFLLSNKKKVSLLVTVFISSLLVIYSITTRPQLFDIILFLLEFLILENYLSSKRKKCLFYLPILSFLLINLHASMWLLLFVFLLPYYAEYLINKISKKDSFSIKPLVIMTIIMFLVGFLNPYGIRSMSYLFKSYGIDLINEMVGEMKPLVIENNLVLYAFFFLGLYSFYYNKGHNQSHFLFLYLGCLYLCLLHQKSLLHCFLSLVLVFSYNFKDVFEESEKVIKLNKKYEFFCYFLLLFLFALTCSCIHISYENETLGYQMISFLNDTVSDKSSLKIYTGYNTGGYLEYYNYKVYIDPRAEVFLKSNNLKEDILLEYYNLQLGNLNYQEFLEKYQFDYLVLEKKDILRTYLKLDNHYKLVYDDKVLYSIYKRIENEEN